MPAVRRQPSPERDRAHRPQRQKTAGSRPMTVSFQTKQHPHSQQTADARPMTVSFQTRQHQHSQHTAGSRPMTVSTQTRQYPHLQLRLKQLQMQEDRQADIDRENKLMFKRMTEIMSRDDKNQEKNEYEGKSLNAVHRERQQDKIMRENLEIAQRIESAQPFYVYRVDRLGQKPDDRGGETSRSRSDLWMYYGLSPRYSDDEDDVSPRGPKTKEYDEEKDRAEKQREVDAKQLFKVANSSAVPHSIIIRTLARKSFQQRMKTKETYRELYEQDLETDLKKGLGREWSLLIETLLNDQSKGQSKGVSKSMKSRDPVAMVKKLTPLSNQELADLKEDYHKEKSRNLESDITKKFTYPTETLLLTLAKGNKEEKRKVSERVAERDARALFEYGSGRWTSKKGKFIHLLGDRMPVHMNSVFIHYKILSKGKPVTKAVQEECTKDYAQVVSAYVHCTESAGSETADKLHDNLDATNPIFVKTVVARSETDMPKVRKTYKKKYGKELVDALIKRSDHTTIPVLKVLIEKNPPKKKSKQKRDDGAQTQTREAEDKKEGKKEGDFDPGHDAERLYSAMKGLGTKESVIIDIIPQRTNAQRQEIKEKYKGKYKKDLVKDLDSELSGDFGDAILGLMMTPVEYDAHCLYKSMKGLGTDETILIGIICSKTDAEMEDIKKQYKAAYKKDLKEDVRSDTSGDFRELLLKLLGEDNDEEVDKEKAENDAQIIHDNPNEEILKEIFIKSSGSQVKATADAFQKLYGGDISDAIRKGSSGDLEEGYLARVKFQQDPVTYYTDRLHNSMKGLGTKEAQLTRILITTSETHLPAIKSKYQERSGITLDKAVESETSGDYRKTLLKIIRRDEQKDKKGGVEAGKDTKGEKEEARASKEDKTEAEKENDTVDEDVTRLYKAMKGLGTNENEIVDIIPCRTNAQRQQIKERYMEVYKKDLDKELDSELSGDLGELILALMVPSDQYEAESLTDAMKGRGADETALIGIICSKTPQELTKLKDTYKKNNGKDLEQVVAQETKGDFKDVLLEILKGQRDTSTEVDKDKAEEDARLIGNKHDLNAMKELYSKGSPAQIKATEEAHQRLYNMDIRDSIKDACSGDEEKLYLALANSQGDISDFYVERLYKSMKGLGTNDSQLIRILVSRSEIDLEEIKMKYQQKYGRTLRKDVEADTSGDYRRTLLSLIDGAGSRGGKKDEKKRSESPIQKEKVETVTGGKTRSESPRRKEKVETMADSKKRSESPRRKEAESVGGKKDDKRRAESPRRKEAESVGGKKDDKRRSESPRRKEKAGSVKAATEKDSEGAKKQKESPKTKTDDRKKKEDEEQKKKEEADRKKKEEEDQKKKESEKKKEGKAKTDDIKKRTDEEQTKKEEADRQREQNDRKKMEEEDQKEKNAEKKKKEEEEKNDDDETDDATRLYKAMKGFGTDEDVILDIIPCRTNAERQQIKARYKHLYDKDLEDDLKSELSRDFEEVIVALMMPPVEYDAFCLHKAMHGFGTDESAVIEIICSKTPAEMAEINTTYKKMYNTDLHEDIQKETSGEFGKLISELAQGLEPGTQVDKAKAKEDATEIYEEPSEKCFIRVFTENSRAQINATAEAHQELFNEGISESLKRSSSSDAEKTYIALIEAFKDESNFYTMRLNDAMKGLGTKDSQLIRILVSRSEIDLPAIKTNYEKLYGKPLRDAVHSDTSGDYRKALLKLIDGASEMVKEEKEERKEKEMESKDEKVESKEGEAESKQEKEKRKEEEVESKEGEVEGKEEGKGNATRRKTLKPPAEGFRAEVAAIKLFKFMENSRTDVDGIISVLTNLSNKDRQKTKTKYQELYKRDLLDDLGCEFSGDLKEAILALMMEAVEYDAFCLHEALQGLGTDDTILIGMLTTKKAAELEEIKRMYKKIYQRDLETAIRKDTRGGYKDLLLELVKGERDQSFRVNKVQAEMDAITVHDNPSTPSFTDIFVKSSRRHIKEVAEVHKKLFDEDISESIRKVTGVNVSNTYVSIVKSCSDETGFYAERLNQALHGLGTDDTLLIRLIVSKSESGLQNIQVKYQNMFRTSLRQDVEKDVSGDYRKVLLSLIDKK